MGTDDEVQESLHRLSEAIKEYAQLMENDPEAGNGDQIIVTAAVVMWEQASFHDDDTIYRIRYAFPERLSLSSALGVAHLGVDAVESDLMGTVDADD